MALKYYFEFTDVETIIHRVEIFNTEFVGNSTEINGSCSLEYSETKDTLEPVKGSGLQIDLDANSDLTFYDLYSEEERTFSVVYKRDNVTLFNGWLSPEGIYESLVSDKWVISLDCTDGLGFLANLSYVDDSTGLPFSGKQSALEIITNCLKRTKTPQNILTSINIYYNGLSQLLDSFDNIYFNSNRFIKDDDNTTIMDCEEVLKSVLEPFGAVITSYKGEWAIYKPNYLSYASSQVFFTYNSNGVSLGVAKIIDFTFDLGSQIDNYYPHHVNANQQKTVKSSIGAYRINYKYGLVKSFISNTLLKSNSDTDIPDYTIQDASFLTFPLDRTGIFIDSDYDAATQTQTDVLTLSNSITFIEGDRFIYKSTVFTDDFNNASQVLVKFVGVTTTYYLKLNQLTAGNGTTIEEYSSTWETTFNTILQFSYGSNRPYRGEMNYIINSLEFPEDGVLELIIMNSVKSSATTGSVEIRELSLDPISLNDDIKGENHTFQRTLKPSSKIKDVKEVFNGDNPSDIYIGTIYKDDQATPTDFWTRKNENEVKPILQIMGEERMKMYAKPLQVYSGDVYGYFNYLSIVTINNLTGKFMATKYNYNALTNITSLELTEVLNTDILSDIDYEVTFDYGNVVEPTIKG